MRRAIVAFTLALAVAGCGKKAERAGGGETHPVAQALTADEQNRRAAEDAAAAANAPAEAAAQANGAPPDAAAPATPAAPAHAPAAPH